MPHFHDYPRKFPWSTVIRTDAPDLLAGSFGPDAPAAHDAAEPIALTGDGGTTYAYLLDPTSFDEYQALRAEPTNLMGYTTDLIVMDGYRGEGTGTGKGGSLNFTLANHPNISMIVVLLEEDLRKLARDLDAVIRRQDGDHYGDGRPAAGDGPGAGPAE